mgnify:CR=1 FL=1
MRPTGKMPSRATAAKSGVEGNAESGNGNGEKAADRENTESGNGKKAADGKMPKSENCGRKITRTEAKAKRRPCQNQVAGSRICFGGYV